MPHLALGEVVPASLRLTASRCRRCYERYVLLLFINNWNLKDAPGEFAGRNKLRLSAVINHPGVSDICEHRSQLRPTFTLLPAAQKDDASLCS